MMKSLSLFPCFRRAFSSSVATNFVPRHNPSTKKDVIELENFVNRNQSIVVLTGAGVSTESGLPDYRSEDVGLYARTNHKPVQHREFIENELRRKAYWARNYVAWSSFIQTKPNKAHYVLSEWQRMGKVRQIVTQNVDRLHQKAGATDVIELHGSGFIVKCLSCTYEIDRYEFQIELDKANASSTALHADGVLRPDGDVYIEPNVVEKFNIPPCPKCGGNLKPNIIFFGDNVPKSRVEQVYSMVGESDALLVVGSSLQVYSGYRFVLHALEKNKEIAVLNIGPTRADHLNSILFIRRRAGEILPQIKLF